MKKRAPIQPCLLFTVFTLCVFTFACGGGHFNDPPGFAASSVAPTQNPLVAQFTMTTALGCSGQVMVEFGPDTSYGRTTAWSPAPAYSQTTTILVAGMRASTTYHMRATAEANCAGGTSTFLGPDTTFKTGPLPALQFPPLAVSRPSPSQSTPENPGIELVDVTTFSTPALFTDRDANPIWYYDVGQGNFPFTYKLLPNGHIVISITLAGADSILREVDLAGNTIREMDISVLGQKMQTAGYDFVPTAYHHDLLPLDNGHLIVLTNFSQNFNDIPGYGSIAVVGDALVDLDQNWNPVWAWNSFDHQDSVFNVNRHLNGLPDWTHSNALLYSAVDGNLLLSMRHQSWVFKIDYNNGAGAGDILWKLGYEGDFALSQNGVPTADPSEWFSFQHFPSIINQNGSVTNLTIWDNGDSRPLDTSGNVCGAAPSFTPCYSRATIYQVDEGSKVADLQWDNLPGYFGVWGGSINQLENGNVEYDLNAPTATPAPTFGSEVREVTQTSSPQIVWKMDLTTVNENAYRAYRVPSLYPGVTWPY